MGTKEMAWPCISSGRTPFAEINSDRSDLRLAAEDMAVIAQARATGARVITVLYSGRPMVLGAALDASDAFVAAWLPGTEGCGLTDVLFGAPNPKAYSRALGRARTNSSQIVSDPATADVEFTRGFELSY